MFGLLVLKLNNMDSDEQYDFDKLRSQFRMFNWFQKRYLRKHFGRQKAKEWTREAKEQFDILLPDLPYIGNKEYYFTRFLVMTAMLTPMTKTLHEEGIIEREVGKMIFDLAESFYKIIPSFIRHRQGKKLFTPESKEIWKQRCKESQERQIPFDWACEYIEGEEGDNFDYGFNMTKCGNVEYWKEQGLSQYVPYLCLCDWPGWKANNVEASRTKTLAQGDEYCDFRYIRYGKNGLRGWPPETLEEWKKRKI